MNRQSNKPRNLIMRLAEKMSIDRMVFDRKPKPGEIVQSLSDKDRALLKELKSSDVSNVRWPWWKK